MCELSKYRLAFLFHLFAAISVGFSIKKISTHNDFPIQNGRHVLWGNRRPRIFDRIITFIRGCLVDRIYGQHIIIFK